MPATQPRPISVSSMTKNFSELCLISFLLISILVVQKGTSLPPDGYGDFNFTNVQVSIDDAYACTIYTSCKQTSFIAAAGVSSAVGFMNFLGSNGAPYSKSYINFTEDNTDQTPGYLNSKDEQC